MALIKCPECNNQISELASSCPHCGFPLSKEIVSKIKNDEQKRIEEELKAKEQKERERLEFLDSLEISNSNKGNTSKKLNIPKKENHSQSERTKKGNTRIISYIFISLIIVLLVIVVSKSFKTEDKSVPPNRVTKSEEQLPTKKNAENKSEILKYKISEKQDVSYLNTPRMVYRIILDINSLPTEEEMKNTAINIWENGNKNWKEFTVFIYLPEMNTGLTAYGVGEFNNNGLVSFDKNEYSLYGTKWEIKETKKVTKEVPVAKLKEYVINLSSVKINDNEIKISIKTDFPDGTNFLVSVGRIHYLQGVSEEYSGNIFDKDFSVNQGKIETILKVNDSEWYNEHQRLVKALPDDIKPISKISDNINIQILYSAARTQTNDVKKILGTRGEFIAGKGVDKFGTGIAGQITTFRVSKDVNFPFQK